MNRPFFPRSRYSREPLHRRNGKIRAREVRVLDEEKRQLGVMSLNDALRLAQNKGLDLVEIAANATPVVCRIVDYGKFMYEEAKRTKDSQARQSAGKLKELQLSPTIDPHDFSIKLNRAIEFLCDDMKVRIKLRFRGRHDIARRHAVEAEEAMRMRCKTVTRRAGIDYRHVTPPARQVGRCRKPGKAAADDDRIMFHLECSGS